jgi:1,4-dihydroxy-2-naphthoate octaprenyltransferase
MANSIKKWLVIARFWSLPVAIISVTAGSAFAAKGINLLFYALMVAGMASMNAAVNILNDIYDFRHGVDKKDDPEMLKRGHPLVTGSVTEKKLFAVSALLVLLPLACGIYLAIYRGPVIIAIGAIGAIIIFFYTAGRKNIKSTGLGELFVFLVYGPMIVGSAYFVEMGVFSWDAIAASIPVGLAIALVLLANNMRDIAPDTNAGVMTLASRLGIKSSGMLFGASLIAIYASVALFSAMSLLPVASLIALISMPYGIKMGKELIGVRIMPPNAAELVSRFVIIFGILLAAGIAI